MSHLAEVGVFHAYEQYSFNGPSPNLFFVRLATATRLSMMSTYKHTHGSQSRS